MRGKNAIELYVLSNALNVTNEHLGAQRSTQNISKTSPNKQANKPQQARKEGN